jgi:hypothetical protein
MILGIPPCAKRYNLPFLERQWSRGYIGAADSSFSAASQIDRDDLARVTAGKLDRPDPFCYKGCTLFVT